MMEFQVRLRRRGIAKVELLEDLRRVAKQLGVSTLTRVQYDEHGLFGATTVLRNFGRWNSALREASLAVANRQDISNDELFENLAAVWMQLGRQPFGREMSDRQLGSQFSTGTYEKCFGSWNGALIAFSNHLVGEVACPTPVNKPNSKPAKRTARDINWRLRARVLIRDGCICKICGDSPLKNPEAVLHVDHIHPWSLGGETVEENLQTLCAKCNIGKSNVVLQSG